MLIKASNPPYYLEPSTRAFCFLSFQLSDPSLKTWPPPTLLSMAILSMADVPPHDLIALQEAQPTNSTNFWMVICFKVIKVLALCVLSMLDDYDMVELGLQNVAVVVVLVFSRGGVVALLISPHAAATVVPVILDGTVVPIV